MSQPLPDDVAHIGELVVQLAGGYLHNTIRGDDTTCQSCAGPLDECDDDLFGPCLSQRDTGIPIANRVASMVYAFEFDTQAYKLVRNYKGANPGPSQLDIMRPLLALGLRGHSRCAVQLAGAQAGPVGWSVVSSTRNRAVLRELVAGLARNAEHEVVLESVPSGGKPRRLDPATVRVSSPPPHPTHVLLVDDSWVSGGHARSAAAALKVAGVDQVSIFTVARVIDPRWSAASSLTRRLSGTFDP